MGGPKGRANPGTKDRIGSIGEGLLREAQDLYRSAHNHQLLNFLESASFPAGSENAVRLAILRGMAWFDVGNVVQSIRDLDSSIAESRNLGDSVQFGASFAQFVRESDFLAAEEVIPRLSRLRQLASQAGDVKSLASLHLAVARVEGCRGHCASAHHHLEMARSLAGRSKDAGLSCTVDAVEASLETVAGNLERSKQLALACLNRADAEGFVKYQLAALENLAVSSTYSGNLERARGLLTRVIAASSEITFIRFGALDTLAQLELREGHLDGCKAVLGDAKDVLARDVLPARSWYDLAHQVTRCTYFEQLNDWDTIIGIAEHADAELARRQFKAIRTALLCAKARAFTRLGRHHDASAALTAAVRVCPKGAVDPLIVLEASKALCASLRGDVTNGGVHYDRAIAACRAIGHRYHEWWIARQQQDVQSRIVAVTPGRPQADVARTSLILSDVATILGAGHSIDLLAHRLTSILHTTPMAARMEIVNESGREYRPEPSAEWELSPDGTCTIRLEGSDRLAVVTIRDVMSIEEISLVKGLADGGATTLARAVMEPRFETAEPWEPLDAAFLRLQRSESSSLVVLDRGRVVGLVTPEHIGDALTLGRALRARRQRLHLTSGKTRTA